MKARFKLVCFLVLTLSIINAQVLLYDGYIETRKLFLFGPDNGFEYAQLNRTNSFLFQRAFDNVPRVGLAVYTIDFQYSPDFSCRITAATNKTATAVIVQSINENVNNRLYIMYIATDNDQVGIFVPDRLYTYDLSLPNRVKQFQNFDFNFKEEISNKAKLYTDIKVSVYLTGLSTTSQMTTNGFPTNRTSISLRADHSSTKFYTLEVRIGEDFPYVLVDWIQCTVVYFIPEILSQSRYQMNSGVVSLKAYGGTVMPVSQSVDLLPLALNNRFENLKFFFGISRIECKDGASVTLLGVEKYYTSPQDNSVRLLLQMQTWKLTLMQVSSFNYIQYKSLKCSEPGANCNTTCGKDLRPFYFVASVCNYCHYSCLTCNLTNLDTYCDTCHVTRTINTKSHLCDCLPQFYETWTNYTCADCFPCATCEKANTCQSCLDKQHMMLNPVTSECQCKAPYYPNYVDSVSKTYVRTQPCLACPLNCLYCLTPSVCLACSMSTYLSNGTCLPVCTASQRFSSVNNTCSDYDGDLFDQQGRLDFDWSYKTAGNEMIIDLIFSQANMSYYYVENGKGYTYEEYRKEIEGGNMDGGSGNAIFYDDGIYQSGYDATANGGGSGSNGEGSSNGGNGGNGLNGSNGSNGSGSNSNGNIDQSALRGQYYGYGQTRFFQLLYENSSVSYYDQYLIPYGKYRISTAPLVSNPNFIQALSRNLVFKISDQVIPYTMQGVSSNHFILRTRPTKTYINALGAIQIKNQALVRSGKTALQKNRVTKEITRFDFYTQQQLSSAYNIKNSNSILVDILWGICKYFLFVGFGWPFIPIMLTLQYIMSFNYIHSYLPLNLDYFLASFRDFRNPSLFYNPFKNQFDAKVVNHPNIYKSVPQLEEFDHGLDFMKNCWEFFFIPILACALLFLLYLLNLIFRKCCRRDFCLISKFLVPRAPLLIAAYTLVQALPVSFFFFSQLKDTTFRHPLEPNRAYPTFNTAMAYLAFFLTCAIPILLLAWLYYHFNYGSRISEFSDANVFNRKFLGKIDNQSGRFSRAQLKDPLWGGNHAKTGTYIFGIAIFALAIIFGFFIAFFIKDFGWQLAGILFFTVLFLAFIIAAKFFQNRVIKVFFIILTILMLAYLLLHAGIGSNRSIGTYDQWNTGYLGIGIIYAMIITAILFTAYLLYKFFKEMYANYHKYGCWQNIDKKNEAPADRKQVERVTEYRRDTKMNSKFLKSGIAGMGMTSGLQNNLGSHFQGNNNILTSNVKKIGPEDDILHSQDRMLVHTYERPENQFQQLVFNKEDPYRKEISFVSRDNNILFAFPDENGRILLQRQPIYIDSENRVYDRNKDFIDFYANLCRRDDTRNMNPSRGNIRTSYQTITSKKEIFVINGEEFEKIAEEGDGNMLLKNMKTGETRTFNMSNFKKTSSSLLQYNSNSNIKEIQEKSKILHPNKHIIYNGEQYLDMGYDPYFKEFKFLNSRTNEIQKVSKPRYIKMIEESFKKRLTIGADEFDYEGTDQFGKVYLVNNRTKEQLIIPQTQFEKHRQANLKAFHSSLEKDLALIEDKPPMVMYQGEQYQDYGVDEQGRHRLYSPKLKKHILISENDFKSLTGPNNRLLNTLTGSQNLLLLQSSVGMKMTPPAPREPQIPQIKLQSQTSKYFIFQEENGQKIYVPKSKIDPDTPIELDEYGNLSQNGKVLMNLQQQSKRNSRVQQKTQTLVTSSKNVLPYAPGSNVEMTPINVQQTQQFEQLQQADAINPDSYYKIMGIPEDKVVEFEFKAKDVYLTQRNVKGKDVMLKIQKIQAKYSNLVLLVRNQSNQSEEFWIR